MLFVLTMPSERADNRAKLKGTTMVPTFANWQHKVQNKYALFFMIDNVSHVSCLKIFPGECVCTFCFDSMFTFSLITLH